MKVLYIYQFFATEKSPDYLRALSVSRRLAEKGHQVSVIATNFNRFTGELDGPPYESIAVGGSTIDVYRVPSTPKYRKNLFYRLLNYAQFSLHALTTGLKVEDYDIVIVSLPPLFAGPVGWMLARLKKKPFVLEIQDLWPDALEVKGALRSKLLLKPLYGLARFLYKHNDYIISVTYGIRDEIVLQGAKEDHVAVLANGLNERLFADPQSRYSQVRREQGWNEDFVVIYVGTLVQVTSMDTVVRAAEKLKEHRHIRFEIFGSGDEAPRLEEMIREKSLSNCRLNGTVPKEKVPYLLGAADACVMCLIETPLENIYLQNKLFDYMGTGRPVVAALRGHQAQIIENVGAGLCVPPHDADALAQAILYLADNEDRCKEMGEAGREYAMEYFSMDRILDAYAWLIDRCARGDNPSVAELPVSSYLPLPR